MDYELAELTEKDRCAVLAIFNYFVDNSFAAFHEEPVGDEFFDRLLTIVARYPAVTVRTETGEVAGFGFLRPFHPAPTLRRTAEIGYFLMPEHTRKGLGNRLLDYFFEKARAMGVDNLVASVSSLNQQSLQFHEKAGFTRCGTFRAVGYKRGRDFDVVYFQKRIDSHRA